MLYFGFYPRTCILSQAHTPAHPPLLFDSISPSKIDRASTMGSDGMGLPA